MKQKSNKRNSFSFPPHPGIYHSPTTNKFIVRVLNQNRNKHQHPIVSVGQYDTEEQAELIYQQYK